MKYSLGLDIGVASIGWAVIDLDKKRLHKHGVRIFEEAEGYRGASLSEPRRNARSARKRLRRRRQRLNALKQFFIDRGLLEIEAVEKLLLTPRDPYALRVKALDEKLTNEELFVSMYHLAKRRGYKSNRRIDADEGKASETGRVLKALNTNQALLRNNNYRTVGEALLKDETYAAHRRNKRDDYTNSFARQDFTDELLVIIEKQRQFGLNLSDDDVRELVYGISYDENIITKNAIMYQRPFMTRELMEKMIGICTFEDGSKGEKPEKRAPRGSFSFEIFRLASELAHVVFIPNKDHKAAPNNLTLSPDTIRKIIEEVKDNPTLTYKKVRRLAGVDDGYKFTHVRGKITEGDPHGENNIFGSLKAYHDIKRVFTGLPDEWKKANNDTVLDEIALRLTIQKTDKEIKDALSDINLSEAAKDALIKVKPANFRSFGHLSIKAVRNITPYIIQGNTYDKACEFAGYDFRQKEVKLEQITNPVVKRSISQGLKVVKAVQRKYGKPYFIRVETSRDLAKNFSDRKNIEQEQKDNQAKNEKIIKQIKEYVASPTGQQIIKFKLFKEQKDRSLYSGQPIDVVRLFMDDNAYQIDHIIPFSRSGNDSLANKALVTTQENQEKGDKTPFEAFGNDQVRWRQFVTSVEAAYITRSLKEGNGSEKRENYKYNGYAFKKKNNLLVQDYKNDGWNARALNDTRYITRFVQNYLRQNVDFAEGEDRQRIFTPNGTLVSYMRKRLGLPKIREQDVLHHAVDAAVVAAMGQDIIQQANLYAKRGEIKRQLQNAKTIEEKTNLLTGEVIEDDETYNKAQREFNAHKVLTEDRFPEPWLRFGDEVRRRTKAVPAEDLQNELRGFDSYDDEFRLQVQPIFVSRMPNRKTKGEAHEATLRSPNTKDGNQRAIRKPLSSINLKSLQNSTLLESDKKLYQQLEQLLKDHDDNPAKAFAEPVYKGNKRLDKNGCPLSPVSAIKVYETSPDTSGFMINDGRAFVNNKTMVRVDIYMKRIDGREYPFFVPVYARQFRSKERITLILPALKGQTHVDDSFRKVCSLYKNHYVRIKFEDENKNAEGYYRKYGNSNAAITLMPHAATSEDQAIVCSARNAIAIEKFDISTLGDNAPRD